MKTLREEAIDIHQKEKELLAEFHHTISEQLNSRLSESPKFFALLVVISTGYGFVLSDSKFRNLTTPALVLALAATLWASWYLAALGYAFRFLQTCQHHIEKELGWNPKYVLSAGNPPRSYWNPLGWFWLLPGIYHAHAAGLGAFFVIVCFTGLLGYCRWLVSFIGVFLIASVNILYLVKFKRKKLASPIPEDGK
jgi:hypothetical protein